MRAGTLVTLDLACLLVVVLAALSGAFLGALSQLAHLGAVLGGYVGARLFGPTLAAALRPRLPLFAAEPSARLAAFVACALVSGLLAKGVLGLFAGPTRGSGADRGLGALLGSAQAALVVWTALSLLAAFGRPVRLGPFSADPRGSELVALARRHGAFGNAWPGRGGTTFRGVP